MNRLILVFCIIGLALPAWAQSGAGTASIEGYVVDPGSDAIPGAKVQIRNTATGLERVTGTGATGSFVAQALPVGPYEITVSAAGFATERVSEVSLQVGAFERLTVKMRIATLVEGAVVTQEVATVETETAGGVVINSRAVSDLPLRGRNFTEFVQLAPAITQESDRSGLVISGQRSINSNITIDGADFNDALLGNQRGGNESVFFFPQTAVREFQVVNSGASAEVGRTGGGFVNVVTKSGTNEFHGEALFSHRDKHFTSPDGFDRSLDNRQNQVGGSAGGPIKKDTLFFFAGAEQNLLRVPFEVHFQPQAANVAVPREFSALEGEQHGTNNPTATFAKMDWVLPGGHSLNLQYAFTHMKGENFDFESSQQDGAASTNYTREGGSNALKGAFISLLTPRALNEVRGQWATDDRDEAANSPSSLINITGFGRIDGSADRPRHYHSDRYQLSDTLAYTSGKHQLRLGTDFNLNKLQQVRESNLQGRYDFKSLADYLARKIDRFRQTVQGGSLSDLTFRGTQHEAALFFQDKIALRRDLSLSAGLRWEGQWNPQPARANPAVSYTQRIPNDLAQWQPRLGLVWNPRSGGTVVRVHAGVYGSRTPGTLLHRVFLDNGVNSLAVDSRVDARVLQLVQFPNPLKTLPAGFQAVVPRIFGFDPSFRNPETYQVSAGVERTLWRDSTLSLSYIRATARHLQRRLDRNLFPPTIAASGLPVYPKTRPDPSIGRLSINESTANAQYDAMVVSFLRRFGKRYQFQTSYTLAKNMDDDSNERNYSNEMTMNFFDLRPEWTYSKQDVRHNLKVNGLVDLGRGVTLGAILFARSAYPYTAIIGTDQQNDSNDENDHAIINGVVSKRNQFRQSDFFNLDVRGMKSFRLGERAKFEVMVEGLNITRARNLHFGPDSYSVFGTPASPVASAGQPLFAPSTARFGGPRQLQLGVRAIF